MNKDTSAQPIDPWDFVGIWVWLLRWVVPGVVMGLALCWVLG